MHGNIAGRIPKGNGTTCMADHLFETIPRGFEFCRKIQCPGHQGILQRFLDSAGLGNVAFLLHVRHQLLGILIGDLLFHDGLQRHGLSHNLLDGLNGRLNRWLCRNLRPLFLRFFFHRASCRGRGDDLLGFLACRSPLDNHRFQDFQIGEKPDFKHSEPHSGIVFQFLLQLVGEIGKTLVGHDVQDIDIGVLDPFSFLIHAEPQSAADFLAAGKNGFLVDQCADLKDVGIVPSLFQRGM